MSDMRLKDKTLSANTGLDAIKRAPIVEYDTGLKCIRIQDISQGKNYDEWGFTETSEKDRKNFLLKKNDLLIARTGATVGVSKIITSDINSVYNNGTIRLRLEKSLNPRFVYYIFQTKGFLQYIDNISCVATQPNLRIEGLLRFTIPDYSIEKQNAIVKTLSTFDDLIENNNKRIKLLEQMAENLYKEWFVRFRFPVYENLEFVGTLPIGWQYQPISESMDFFDSKRVPLSSKQRDEMEKIYPYYGAAKLMDYVDNYLFDGEYLLLGEDGTVVTTDGFPVLQLVNDKFWVNNHAHVIRGKGNISTRFLYLTFCRFPITGVVTGSAQPKISKGRLEKLKILVPDAITMEHFNNLINPMFDEINVLKKQLIRITKQRDMLLPRLMSGKLEV